MSCFVLLGEMVNVSGCRWYGYGYEYGYRYVGLIEEWEDREVCGRCFSVLRYDSVGSVYSV